MAGYPQRRVLDLTSPYEGPPVVAAGSPAATGAVPVPWGVSAEDRDRTEQDLVEDRRAERGLVAKELLALVAVVLIVLVRQIWLL